MNENESNVLLDIKNLHTYFFTDNGVVKSVDGVDIKLKKGSTLGIVGESGSGKSVTALSVMNLLMGTTGKVVEGSISLDGKDIINISEEEKRKLRGGDLAMIFQEPMTSLNPVLKIGDQISEAIIEHFDVSKKEAIDKTIDILKKISIPRAE
jgi:ABC-type dipeptide/oligopeptide/nickel transport system ATPase component